MAGPLLLRVATLAALFGLACGKGKLLFRDDFNDFDLAVWDHDISMSGGGTFTFDYATNNRSNSFTSDGVLYIKPTYTADKIGADNVLGNDYSMSLYGWNKPRCTGAAANGCLRSNANGHAINPIQSAHIRTVKSFATKYGRVEIVARLPRGDWIWPGLWMMPKYNQYGTWPQSGEIDICESWGNNNTGLSSTLHWGPYTSEDKWQQTHHVRPDGDAYRAEFHKYVLEWTPTSLQTWVGPPTGTEGFVQFLNVSSAEKSFWEMGGWGDSLDNPWAGRGNNAPFDQEFYLIFNVAVGGTNGYFPDDNKAFPNKPWRNDDKFAMKSFWQKRALWQDTWKGDDVALKIDSVAVYDLSAEQEPKASKPAGKIAGKEAELRDLQAMKGLLSQDEYDRCLLKIIAGAAEGL